MKSFRILLACLAFSVSPMAGQTTFTPPIVRASGNGLVELSADHAAVVLGVQVEASTPDSAAARMSVLLDSVTDTLVSLGIPRDSLPTSRIDLRPRFLTIEGERVTSYQANSLVRVRVWDLDRVGEILSSAVTAGATTIETLDYRSTREREGRDEALRLATEEANRDARVMAEAQGLELSRLVSASSTRSSVGFDRTLVIAAASAARRAPGLMPAEIVPIGVSISVQVSVEWEIR
jgi:uncharacterized protein YggE